ncbi:MAG: cysteine desulfurase [Proteobacteria bacterium]|nr:cysteine desulfurase [Pseudomonadota bacterium]NCA28327.1 cysteine desulfurase [Pseudomonadota bacterium]
MNIMNKVFLDFNSTTPMDDAIIAKIHEITKIPLNSSAIHSLGRYANSLIDESKSQITQLLNAHNYEIIFTSSATEATNTVFFGNNFDDIIISSIEHASVYNCRPQSSKISEIKCKQNGVINIEDLIQKIPDHKNFLVSTMLCNNETGVIQPVEEIAQITHQNLGLFHCDAVQALGKIPVDLEKINPDFVSVSAHKICGPQGIGALLYRKGLDFRPLIFGGKQQKSKRAGSLNITGIVGFGHACSLANEKLKNFSKIAELRDYLEEQLQIIAQSNIIFFGKETMRLANTCFYSIRNLNNQTQLINFDLNNICVSAGASCSSGTISQSRILQSMGIENDFLDGAIRVSLSPQTTKSDIDYFIKIFSEFYNRTQINKK